MKKFLSIVRNLAHVASGVLLANPDPRYQTAGAVLALLATGSSQVAAKPPKLDGKPIEVKPLTGEIVTELVRKEDIAKRQAGLGIPLMCLIGCLTLSGCGATPEERLDSAVDIVQTAAFNGTLIAVDQHPDWKPHFTQAVQDLTLLFNQENPSLASVSAIVARLPVKQLGGLGAQLIIGNGTLILQKYERKIDLAPVDKKRLISALIAGIMSANP